MGSTFFAQCCLLKMGFGSLDELALNHMIPAMSTNDLVCWRMYKAIQERKSPSPLLLLVLRNAEAVIDLRKRKFERGLLIAIVRVHGDESRQSKVLTDTSSD